MQNRLLMLLTELEATVLLLKRSLCARAVISSKRTFSPFGPQKFNLRTPEIILQHPETGVSSDAVDGVRGQDARAKLQFVRQSGRNFKDKSLYLIRPQLFRLKNLQSSCNTGFSSDAVDGFRGQGASADL
jgi:hypothetical protein